MKKLLLLFLVIWFCAAGAAQNIVTGRVIDSLTTEAIPYANVWIKGSAKGTLTNTLGKYSIDIMGFENDSIEFSLLGYSPKKIPIASIAKNKVLIVGLQQRSVELKTAIVTPITAEEYVRRAMINLENNYNINPRYERFYYREIIKENSNYNRFTEAVLDVYQPKKSAALSDTALVKIKGGHVLDNREYIQFMRNYVKKKVDKQNKKLAKKGEETKEFTDATEYISFSNPYVFVDSNFTAHTPSFLDSNRFDKFEYEIEHGYTYKGRPMICIGFNQIKKTAGNFWEGKIYMDENTYAIQGIDYGWNEKGKRKLLSPAAKAALYLFRLEINNPDLQAKIRFYEQGGVWNLSHYFIHLSGNLTKKYFFEDNETSDFNIQQDFVFIETLNALDKDLPELLRKKPMHKQITEQSKGLNWDLYRKLEPESY